MSDEIRETLHDPEDFDFSKENLKKLYSNVHVADPELWDRRYQRVRDEILFSEVVEDLTGKHGDLISCPFHGTDTTPSFCVYPPARGNMGFCFGCSAPYTHVTFVAKYRGVSKSSALTWLEKNWNLPPLVSEAKAPVDDDTVSTITLEFSDLSNLYVSHARKDITQSKEYELAEEYLRIYFEAEQEEDQLKQVKALGEVLGAAAVARIVKQKLRGLV